MVTINNARKILQRVDTLPLYLHAYAFHLNMRLERVLPADLLDIASENNLRGVKIHVLDGERFSLGNMDDKELSAFGDKARRLNLDIHIETSASDKASIDEAVAIALKTGASSVRFYPRYEGNLRDVLSIIANDIAYVRETYQDSGLTFTIEQHEDLKSHELVSLVKESEMESLSLLFDFANMINANEHPIDALKTMAPHITQVHIKDALIVKEPGGLGHDEPQVTAYGLEEEVDYYAPAFRFEDEDDNPWIPYRQMSETPLPENHLLDARLRKEKEDAINQINHVRNVLQQIKQEANHLLNH
ncbi:sugar phosphate isomerase/epimerase family protein [Escherichia coli]|nr:TIM barrel protein [Escherichia coli]